MALPTYKCASEVYEIWSRFLNNQSKGVGSIRRGKTFSKLQSIFCCQDIVEGKLKLIKWLDPVFVSLRQNSFFDMNLKSFNIFVNVIVAVVVAVISLSSSSSTFLSSLASSSTTLSLVTVLMRKNLKMSIFWLSGKIFLKMTQFLKIHWMF